MSDVSCYEYNVALIRAYHKSLLSVALRCRDLDLAACSVEESQQGAPTLRYQGVYLHSAYDPVREAARFVQSVNLRASCFFVLGVGFGYHLNALVQGLKDPDAVFFVFEWSECVFCAALESVRLDFLGDPRVCLYVGVEGLAFCNSVSFSESLLELSRAEILFLESEYLLFREEYYALLVKIRQTLAYYLQNSFTCFEFEKLWLKNMLSNIAHGEDHSDVSALFGRFEDFYAVVVSAGPSLAASLTRLKSYENRVFVIASDTAVGPLLSANITPDFVVSVDAQLYNFRDFYSVPPERLPCLMYDVAVYPAIPKYLREARCFYFSSLSLNSQQHPFLDFVREACGVSVTHLAASVSVSSAAVELARLMGFQRILLLGQDLQYSFFVSHCVAAPAYNEGLERLHRFSSLETFFYASLQRDPDSTLCPPTSVALKRLAEWFDEYACAYPELLLSVTPYSLLKLPCYDLGFLCDRLPPIDKYAVVRSVEPRVYASQAFYAFMRCAYIALGDFAQCILQQLHSESLDVQFVEECCDRLALQFPFIRRVYVRDRFWFYRKKNPNIYSKSLYLNTLLCSTLSIVRRLNKLLTGYPRV